MTSTIARISGLRFEYPGVRALHDVGFELRAGTVTALVGPNGAGKSTLMRCLAGLETPALGEVEVDGIDVIEEPREAHRRLGYLSDFFGVYGTLTVQQCLVHAAAIHGVDATTLDAQARRTAGLLGLADRLEARAGTLSRGLRQRLAIGQAIIHEPKVLLLDEPAAGLDPEARHALAGLFRALQSSGMTLLVSSHILAELDEYSTHMLVLREGRVVEHRELRAAAAMGETRRLRVVLAAVDERLAGLLASLGGAARVEIHGAGAVFDWTGDEPAKALLLRSLVEAGLAVTAFAEERENLNESYLRTLESPR